MTSDSEDCLILKRAIRAILADPLRNLKIRSPDILKQFGKILSHCRVLLEQQFLKHHLMDGDNLLQVQSVKIHNDASSSSRFSGSLLRISSGFL